MTQARVHASVLRGVAVPMRDGVTLQADIWRPAAEGRYPVLLQRLPYDKSATEVTTIHGGLDPLRAVERGYVVIIQDTRGRYASEGTFDPFRCEPQDGADSIAWAAALPCSNGAVGMYGGSYYGATQLLAARERPPALRAIAPSVTSSDYYEGWTYQGGAFALGFVLYWTLFALAPAEILRQPRADQPRLQAILDELLADPWVTLERLPLSLGGLEQILPFWQDWLEHDTRDGWWRALAPNEHYGSIDVPALHIGGWHDIFCAGTLENFERLRDEAATPEARAGQRLVLGPWSHANFSDTIGALQFGPGSSWGALDITRLQLDWFDEHLRGTVAAAAPRVRVFLMGANTWLESDTWPLAGVQDEHWYLHGDSTLGREPPARDEPAATFDYDPGDPVPTLGGATLLPGFPLGFRTGAHDQRPLDGRRDVLHYWSEPLDRDLDVIGSVSATLDVSTSAPDTDFTAKLVDVHPDGRAIGICDGIAALRQRDGQEQAQTSTPGERYQLTVRLGPTANRFRAGHRLRLDVSSSNFPRFARNPNSGGRPTSATWADLVTAHQTVSHDAAHPSFLTLPARR